MTLFVNTIMAYSGTGCYPFRFVDFFGDCIFGYLTSCTMSFAGGIHCVLQVRFVDTKTSCTDTVSAGKDEAYLVGFSTR